MNFKSWCVALTLGAITLPGATTPSAHAADSYPLPITNNWNGRCLDANAGYLNQNGTPIQLWDCYGPGQHNQIWFVYRESGENHDYTIKNKASGRVLDAHLSYIGSNGTPVQLWDNLGAQQHNQRWRVFQR